MGHAEDIIPRDIRFDILGNAQRHWLEDDIIKTILIDGLSIFLPEGERFFIRSLKHYGPKLQDKELGRPRSMAMQSRKPSTPASMKNTTGP